MSTIPEPGEPVNRGEKVKGVPVISNSLEDSLEPDPGSFRDPSSMVLVGANGVFRGFTGEGLKEFEALSKTRFYSTATGDGRLIAAEPVSGQLVGSVPWGFAGVVRHRRIPFLSYPYEWSFTMLKDAAALTLDLLELSLEEGITMKDASAYNIQFTGCSSTFIDVGSFERHREGEPWHGYLQFCQMFLYPLMLEAYRKIDFHPWMRGCLEGITPAGAAKLLRGRDWIRRGVLKHVLLHSKLQQSHGSNRETLDVQAELKSAGFKKELIRRNVSGLKKLVTRLESGIRTSQWGDYRSISSYDEADLAAKRAFVEAAAARTRRQLIWDLGANDGMFSVIASRHAETVVAVDSDAVAIDALYCRLRQRGPANILPLVVDVANPSPGLGWRSIERQAFLSRSRPDMILMLALIHHLAITANIPLKQIVDWLRDQSTEIVVELPTLKDPQVKRLLGQKGGSTPVPYGTDEFESLLREGFDWVRSEVLPSQRRILYHARNPGRR